MNKIIFFDLDGTLKEKDKSISKELISFIDFLWEKGIYTTIITGRNYRSVEKTLGEDLYRIVHPDLLLGVENGSKAVTLDRKIGYSRVFNMKQLLSIKNLLENIRKNVDCIAFDSANCLEKGYLWFLDDEKIQKYYLKYRDSFNFMTGALDELFSLFDKIPFGKVAIKMNFLINDFSQFPCLEIRLNEEHIDINPTKINKAYFVKNISKRLKIPLNKVIVVGNDENDYPMFSLPVKKKVFVLNDRKKENIGFSDLTFCKKPNELIKILGL